MLLHLERIMGVTCCRTTCLVVHVKYKSSSAFLILTIIYLPCSLQLISSSAWPSKHIPTLNKLCKTETRSIMDPLSVTSSIHSKVLRTVHLLWPTIMMCHSFEVLNLVNQTRFKLNKVCLSSSKDAKFLMIPNISGWINKFSTHDDVSKVSQLLKTSERIKSFSCPSA